MQQEHLLQASDLKEGAEFVLASDQILEPGDGRTAAIADAGTKLRIETITTGSNRLAMVLVRFDNKEAPGQTLFVPVRHILQVEVAA